MNTIDAVSCKGGSVKQLFTSYFAKNGEHPLAQAICAGAPSYYRGRIYKPLRSTWEIVMAANRGEITGEEYQALYLEVLKTRGVDPHEVVKELPEGTLLLCYERPGEFCHRHIAAKWIEDHTGIVVPEWTPPPTAQELFVENSFEF